MIKVFLNWVQKTKPHIKSETELLLFVPTIKLTVYLRIPCRIFINSLYNTESNYIPYAYNYSRCVTLCQRFLKNNFEKA